MCWWDSKIPRWILIWFKTDYALKIFQREDRFSCALSFTTCVTLTSCQFSLNFVFLFNQIEIMPKEFQGQRSLVGYSPWHHKELDMIVQLTFFSLSFVLQYVIRIIKKKKKKVRKLSRVWLFVTPWTIAYQAPPSMEFSRQEYWSGLPLPSPIIKHNFFFFLFFFKA